ncbi:response regulator [Chloroflexus aggregans]|uniref:histidine kinase n=1 Tax=Chloroflexus aggregans (strain MD-66 / DSM 9485) TaxID=326427 RepID=B8G7F7_CHLAD|nr:response regulator [Chloroflexus aggregans]ACL25992.1 multi-sensor signal transduction histidine kinase [Chloroflexus aggregans DSM 9485]
MEQNTILVVDDDEQIHDLLTAIVAPLSLHLLVVQRGGEALHLARQYKPDLILLDVMLPDMSGFEVCRTLREDPVLAQIPIVMITALHDREAKIRGFEIGADEFITKPFDLGEMQARITTILRLNRYRRLLQEQARVNAERARFEWVIENSDSAYLIVDRDDRIVYVNACARSYLGLAPNEQPSQSLRELVAQRYRLIPPEAWERWPLPVDIQRLLMHPETLHSPEQWLSVETAIIHPSDDQIVVTFRDITREVTTQRDMWTFHTAISHKLRTPLVSIIGGLNILHDNIEQIDRSMARNIAAIALSGARRLESEINDILRYIDSPSDAYHFGTCTVFDLPNMIATISQDLHLRSVDLSLDPELDTRRLRISRRSLERILYELCDNAIKFHPQRNPVIMIRVTTSTDYDQVRLLFCDDGIHLPPEQLRKIWQPYYQVERSFTGQVEGMGLGLAQVARIVLAFGGSYWVWNRVDRPGLCIELRFPFAEGEQSNVSPVPTLPSS